MKLKKIFFLFLALLFPICIFIFLKALGRNEFAVAPLYTDTYPEDFEACGTAVTLPYHIPDSILAELNLREDSLMLFYFGEPSGESEKQINRLRQEHGSEVRLQILSGSDKSLQLKKCIFFLKDPYDLVLIDRKGVIRGEYISADREDMDRLLTELAILFKRY